MVISSIPGKATSVGKLRYPYRQSDVRAAAHRALHWLEAKNGGHLPRDWRSAWKLTVRCGLSCRHLREASSRDGELAQDASGEWTIFYHAFNNTTAQIEEISDRRQDATLVPRGRFERFR